MVFSLDLVANGGELLLERLKLFGGRVTRSI
jgi:hypothetical protein